MSDAFRGIYVILPTPFHETGALDEEGLRRVVDFSIECGSHGIVTPANASEGPYLSDAERRRVVELVIDACAGRVRVVVSVTAPCTSLALEWTRHAATCGADALILMPPYLQRPSEAEIREYFSAVAHATEHPIFVQNFSGAGGTPMSATLVGDLVRSLPGVHYVKEETDLAGPVMSQIMAMAGENLRGIMGGKAGRHLLDEYARGGCGSMPASQAPDLHSRLWNQLEAGETEAAGETYRLLLPLLQFEGIYGIAANKEVLRRRGVIKSTFHRQAGGRRLDDGAQRELTTILDTLRPLLSDRYPVAF